MIMSNFLIKNCLAEFFLDLAELLLGFVFFGAPPNSDSLQEVIFKRSDIVVESDFVG